MIRAAVDSPVLPPPLKPMAEPHRMATHAAHREDPLAHLPQPDASGQALVQHSYAACNAAVEGYDPADFRRRVGEWIGSSAQCPPCTPDAALATAELADAAAARRVSEDLRSALIAALAIGLAHSTEMLMGALSNHPLVRLSAVSHPFVLGTLLERLLKRLADVPELDPFTRTGARFEEKVAAALVNWNYVQPALDTVLKSPLARTLKVFVTAGISGVRDIAERNTTRAKLAELPPDTPPGPRKLTDMESLFINCLMCWLRNVGVDLARQIVKSHGAQLLPAADGLTERFLRTVVLGQATPGALPATAISLQACFADGVRLPADEALRPDYAYDANNPF